MIENRSFLPLSPSLSLSLSPSLSLNLHQCSGHSQCQSRAERLGENPQPYSYLLKNGYHAVRRQKVREHLNTVSIFDGDCSVRSAPTTKSLRLMQQLCRSEMDGRTDGCTNGESARATESLRLFSALFRPTTAIIANAERKGFLRKNGAIGDEQSVMPRARVMQSLHRRAVSSRLE